MDFKKFGAIILILGIVVFAYGGFKYAINWPEERMHDGRLRVIWNPGRESGREDATTIMIAGGIVAFVGVGMSRSAKKKEP